MILLINWAFSNALSPIVFTEKGIAAVFLTFVLNEVNFVQFLNKLAGMFNNVASWKFA
jgi:hypothetical protein